MTRVMLPLLIVLVLLGNGLRSVISSAVFVSEGAFASFLKISVNQTSAIIELLLGAVLLALLVAPKLIARYPVRPLAMGACLAAAGASFGLAALFWLAPPVATREAVVIVLFPLLGMSLALLAPLAQIMTGWGGERHIKLLTGVWALAMPVAFLVTPQLVRTIAPRHGLDIFFAGFAMVALLLIPATLLARERSSVDAGSGAGSGAGAGAGAGAANAAVTSPAPVQHTSAPAGQSLWPVILVLLAFQTMTTLVTLSGITSPLTQIAGAAFLASLLYLFSGRRGAAIRASAGGQVDRAALGVFAFLFLANIGTTGFFDTAYLVNHMCSNTLIADRATFGALAQAGAAMLTTAVLARFPVQRGMMTLAAIVTAIGVASYLLYFSQPHYWVFVGSKMITGFGMGLLATSAIFFVSTNAGPDSKLPLFLAFVIIIGTEVGLEIFEILIEVLELMQVAPDMIERSVFVLQVAAVLAALLFIPARAGAGDSALTAAEPRT